MSEEEKFGIISIRGVNKEIYKQLTSLSKELGKSVGELVNEAFKLYLSVVEGSEIAARKIVTALSEFKKAFEKGVEEGRIGIIRGIDELEVSKKDLESYGKPVTFTMINKLKFSSDIDMEAFEKYVEGIIMCNEVIVPSTLPKLLVGSKCRQVKKIVVYEA